MNLHAKFVVSSFNLSQDMEGVTYSKSRPCDPSRPVDLILHFFRWGCRICMPNLTFLAPSVPEIWRGPKISKLGHVTLYHPFWPNFAFLSLVPLVMNLHAKFDVSSSIRSRDMEGSQNFKTRSRDPSPPLLT